MDERRKTVFRWVTGTHGVVLLLLLLVPWLKGCFHKKPKIIASFDLSAPPPPAIKPEPAPEPKQEPVKKIAPPKTNAPPKMVEAKKPAPKKVEPKTPFPKPKTLEERLAEVRKGGKTIKSSAPAAKPALDLAGLKSALNSAASRTSSGYGSSSGAGAYSPFAWYYALVQQKMFQVWQQPSSAPKGLTAEATIRVERDGAVSSKSITRRSGNVAFDQSVQNALVATISLPAPPSDLPDRTISIEFVLKD